MLKKLLLALVLVMLSAFLVPTGASAHAPLDLHGKNFRNRTVPGSTCRSAHPIKLHKGHGKGGMRDGEQLVDIAMGKPIFGDLTGDGSDEAFVFVLCETKGGGTVGAEVQSNWVVFTGRTGTVRVLGNIVAQHQWLNTVATVLQDPKVANGVAKVHETIWFPNDPSCCGRGRANTSWWFHNGKLRVKSTTLHITDQIVGATSVGHAKLGMTAKQLRHAYGTVQHSELANGGCDVYWHGKQSKSFGALIDHSTSPKVFGIYAPSGSVTLAGVGQYSSVRQIKHVYAGHTIESGTAASGTQLFVKLAHSWLGFQLHKSGGAMLVNGVRVGTHAFVTGKHTCSS